MKLNKLYSLIIFNLLLTVAVSGQEIHYSHYWKTPTLLNPGLTGQFSGTYRANLAYRDQNRTGGTNPYQTLGLTLDLPVITGFRKRDWVGAGILIGNDWAGPSQKISLFGLNVAYHLGLDKKQTQILSLGVQASSGSFSYGEDFRPGSGIFGDQSQIFREFKNDSEMGDISGGSLNDLQVGLVYNIRGKRSDMKFGAAVDGILSPERAQSGNGDEKSIGINAFFNFSQETSKRLSLEHGLFYYTQDGASAINANSRLFYKLDPNKDLKLVGGLGTRSLRSGIIYTGVRTGPWDVGLSWDFNLGTEQPISIHHGLELGITYLGIVNKRPEPKPILYCPRI